MFKGSLTSGTSTTGNMAITSVLNTNSNTALDSTYRFVNIYTAGYYDVKATYVGTCATTGNVSLQLYANGVAIPNAIATTTATNGNTYTLEINDVIKVSDTTDSNVANISARLSIAGETINSGVIIVERRK